VEANENEAVLSSIKLVMDFNGNLIVEQSRVPIDDLRKTLKLIFPSWDDFETTINASRWVDDYLTEVGSIILKEFGEDESIHLQERNVRPKSKTRVNKKV